MPGRSGHDAYRCSGKILVSADKKVLLIAFHFPPFGGGSGVHRAAKFAQYLPQFGWTPYVLTANPRAYENRSGKAHPDAGNNSVIQAFALDAQRHLSFRGRYVRFSALPDRWSSWVLGAVPRGFMALYSQRIDVIVVTFPIATAVLIALILQRITRKPLV